MKKTVLFFLFTTLCVAAFAQDNGCGRPHEDPNSYSSNSTIYNRQQVTAKADFIVSPNPTTDFFVLDAKSLEIGNASKVNIYNVTGQLVRTFTVAKEARYNVSDLRDGLYLAQFVDAKDKTIATRKLNKSNVAPRF